ANTAFRQFALNTAANIVTENAINIATGNFSLQSFGMSVLSAVVVGGALHAASGLKPVSNLQQSSMAAGERVGGGIRTGMGGTVNIRYRENPVTTGQTGEGDTNTGTSSRPQGDERSLDLRGSPANDNAAPQPGGPDGPGTGRGQPIELDEAPEW